MSTWLLFGMILAIAALIVYKSIKNGGSCADCHCDCAVKPTKNEK